MDDILSKGIERDNNGYPVKWSDKTPNDYIYWNEGDQRNWYFIAGGKEQEFKAQRIEFFGFNF